MSWDESSRKAYRVRVGIRKFSNVLWKLWMPECQGALFKSCDMSCQSRSCQGNYPKCVCCDWREGWYWKLMDCVIEPEVGGLISKNVLKCCVESNTGRARGIREKKIWHRGQAVGIFSKLWVGILPKSAFILGWLLEWNVREALHLCVIKIAFDNIKIWTYCLGWGLGSYVPFWKYEIVRNWRDSEIWLVVTIFEWDFFGNWESWGHRRYCRRTIADFVFWYRFLDVGWAIGLMNTT